MPAKSRLLARPLTFLAISTPFIFPIWISTNRMSKSFVSSQTKRKLSALKKVCIKTVSLRPAPCPQIRRKQFRMRLFVLNDGDLYHFFHPGAACCRLFPRISLKESKYQRNPGKSSSPGSYKLGYKDSNLEMTESESVALPFGDSPKLRVC